MGKVVHDLFHEVDRRKRRGFLGRLPSHPAAVDFIHGLLTALEERIFLRTDRTPLSLNDPSQELWLDPLVVGAIIATAVHGVRTGLFRGVILGMTATICPLAALACSDRLAAILVRCDVPQPLSRGVALLGMVAAAWASLHFAIKTYSVNRTIRLSRAMDAAGGASAGAVAGVMIAGTVLIAYSMLPMPPALRAESKRIGADAGVAVLRIFARCVEGEAFARNRFLQGEPLDPEARITATGQVKLPALRSSEVFADLNLNSAHDDGEPYLDEDGDNAFSSCLPFTDTNSNGKRDIGLLERYRLAAWDSAISVAASGESLFLNSAEVDHR